MPVEPSSSGAWYEHWPMISAVVLFIFSLGGFTMRVRQIEKKVNSIQTKEIEPLKKEVDGIKEAAQQMALQSVKEMQIYNSDGTMIFQTVTNCGILHADFKTALGQTNTILKEIQVALSQRDKDLAVNLQVISGHMGAVNQFMKGHKERTGDT